MDGVLVIDKPVGPSSHDVVARMRRATGVKRIGHTGTLDPLASGVLALVVGRACRLAQFLSSSDKEYEAQVRLGLETDTYDVTGHPVEPADGAGPAPLPERRQVERLLEAFRGPLLQEPPTFSAKKIGGARAYALARRGTPVRPPAAAVTVHRIDLQEMVGDALWIRLTCSAGFYVRSLAHDLGVRLGTGGCLAALRRLRSGEFGLDRAVTLEMAEQPGAAAASLIPISDLLSAVPGLVLTDDGARRAARGNLIGPSHLRSRAPSAADRVRLLDQEGRLIAIAEPAAEPGFLHPGIVVG
jgi:tRNA pseudouridine55 synthase